MTDVFSASAAEPFALHRCSTPVFPPLRLIILLATSYLLYGDKAYRARTRSPLLFMV